MKRKLINIMLILISLIIPLRVKAISTTEAIKPIDTTINSTLIINYYYDDYNFDNTTVKIYQIASLTSNFQYQLSPKFSNYQSNINNIKTESEWNYLNQTINTYITENNINPDIKQKIKDNQLIVKNLIPGLYFIKTAKITISNSILSIDNTIVNVPTLNEDGIWTYEVEIFPKIEEQIVSQEEVSPNTLDNISIYFYLLVLSCLSLIILIASFILNRINNRHIN